MKIIVKKIIDVGKKMWNKLSGWFDNLKTMIGSFSLSDLFSLGAFKFSQIIKKIKGFVNQLYHLIVNSQTFKSIRNFIYQYLIQPFERIQSLIDSAMKKIDDFKSGAMFKKFLKEVTGSIDFGNGLSRNFNPNFVAETNVNVNVDKDGNSSTQKKSKLIKNNVSPIFD